MAPGAQPHRVHHARRQVGQLVGVAVGADALLRIVVRPLHQHLELLLLDHGVPLEYHAVRGTPYHAESARLCALGVVAGQGTDAVGHTVLQHLVAVGTDEEGVDRLVREATEAYRGVADTVQYDALAVGSAAVLEAFGTIFDTVVLCIALQMPREAHRGAIHCVHPHL